MTLEEFDREWDRCSAWLDAALERGGRTHALPDVRELVLGRPETFWFWPASQSAAVTEIIRYPRLSVMRMWLAGGDLDQIKDAIPKVEAHGVLQGCTRFEIIGRIGWARALRGHGYDHRADVCWKEL